MDTPKQPPRPANRRADTPSAGGGSARDARLKAALKANLARRKAQARVRRQGDAPDDEPDMQGAPGHG